MECDFRADDFAQRLAAIVAANDPYFGAGQTLEIAGADGSREVFQVFANIPFVLCQATLVNPDGAAKVLNKVTLLKGDLDAGSPPAELIAQALKERSYAQSPQRDHANL